MTRAKCVGNEVEEAAGGVESRDRISLPTKRGRVKEADGLAFSGGECKCSKCELVLMSECVQGN
jgi:hypothetical protein